MAPFGGSSVTLRLADVDLLLIVLLVAPLVLLRQVCPPGAASVELAVPRPLFADRAAGVEVMQRGVMAGAGVRYPQRLRVLVHRPLDHLVVVAQVGVEEPDHCAVRLDGRHRCTLVHPQLRDSHRHGGDCQELLDLLLVRGLLKRQNVIHGLPALAQSLRHCFHVGFDSEPHGLPRLLHGVRSHLRVVQEQVPAREPERQAVLLNGQEDQVPVVA
mmetsp:Transcript_65046/g.188624  ORF Transcript_65046/g.188624 Transcript_65046/m.188624 type:complete len:215 (-) Transcript_65046:630-1274(-)